MKTLWGILKKVIYRFGVRILHIIGKELSREQWDGIFQFIKFGLVGVSNIVISYIINVLVLLLLKGFYLSWDYIAGNVVSFLLSVLWSFYWNSKYVFTVHDGEQRSLGQALLKTYLSYAFTGIVLNNILSVLWIEIFHISKYIALIINLLVSVPINYLMNKYWAFRGRGMERKNQ